MSHARYIGDGVYAQFDGHRLVLTTGSHLKGECDNLIALEPRVIESLERYVMDLKARLESEPAATPEEI